MKKINSIKNLKLMANQIRQDIILSLTEAKSGHSAGSLGMTDIFTALYFNVMRHNPKKPNWKDRDYFLLSNGHICPALYATLANAGYFKRVELKTLRKWGSRLQGHPHRQSLPGLETCSGPLGSGLSQASGIAYALKMDKKKNKVFCMTSDGEHEEGNIWEAVLFAAKYKLDNLVVILDRNFIQIDGNTEDVMPLKSMKKKYLAFNWHVFEIDGNNMQEIITAYQKAKSLKGKPIMIIAKNIPGKGVSFMENKFEWHGKAPNLDESKIAILELAKNKLRILKQ